MLGLNAGWDGHLVNDSYRWAVAFEPLIRQWQTAVGDGLLESGVYPYNGFTYDHLPGTKVGGTIFDTHWKRHTAADLLRYADPTRITVMLHSTVHKILFRVKGIHAYIYITTKLNVNLRRISVIFE